MEADVAEFIKTLESRFAKNMHRHARIDWGSVKEKLEASQKNSRCCQKWNALAANRM